MLLGVADPAGVSGGAGAVRPPPRPGADHPGRGRGLNHHHTLPSIPAGGDLAYLAPSHTIINGRLNMVHPPEIGTLLPKLSSLTASFKDIF